MLDIKKSDTCRSSCSAPEVLLWKTCSENMLIRAYSLIANKITRSFNMALLGGINNLTRYIIKIFRLHFPVTIFREYTREYAANLQEKTHAEVQFQWSCKSVASCIFSEHLFRRHLCTVVSAPKWTQIYTSFHSNKMIDLSIWCRTRDNTSLPLALRSSLYIWARTVLKIISKNILLCGAEKFTSGMNKEILECTITISFFK